MFKVRIYNVLIISLLSVLLLGNNNYNELQKIDYAQNDNRNNPHIQIGVVKLYFEHDQMVNLLSKNMQETMTLFFPFATVKKKECLQMINTLNRLKSDFFSFRISVVKAPVEGISFSIKHNPRLVSITYDTFQSSELKPGIIIRFFNQHFLERLQNKGAAILSTAFLLEHKQLMYVSI